MRWRQQPTPRRPPNNLYMKTILALITALAIFTANAQTNLVDAVKNSGILQATNYSVEPYLTYAPNNAANQHYGGGVLCIYNFNSYVGAGLGLDYLGQFSLVSGNVNLKAPIDLGKYVVKYASSFTSLSNLTLVPFALGGIGTPLSGSGSSISTILDAGAYIQFGHFAGGKFNCGACWGAWNNAGDYSGKRYHLFVGWSHGF